ncbi:hypothetical protein ATL17_3335 [Maritalea mobilis]|uniref:Uncharacterized protein n=1 Tax=Maritalea mobilis TaxID=483324 RepID=A0A4V3DA36_9HYPH|nr:hypothetical protein ATL17_3335 [Maritalea mobilis]
MKTISIVHKKGGVGKPPSPICLHQVRKILVSKVILETIAMCAYVDCG